MQARTDLTEGPIFSKLVRLALPIIGTSFIHMAYNLTDVIWLGRFGSATVTAVTTAGFFIWLLMALFYSLKSGTETLVSQAAGRKDLSAAVSVAENAVTFGIYSSFVLNLMILIFAADLLQFFRLEPAVMGDAVSYLQIVSFGIFFSLLNVVLSSIYIGLGNSRIPFLVNSLGLAVNIILDPILIFGFSFFPELGAKGAAIATVISNILVFLTFLFKLKSPDSILPGLKIRIGMKKKILRRIFKVGLPVSIQQVAFCLFSMGIARIVSQYGTIPLGVQNVGANIEALSWSTALGFSTALGSFTGQNFGAGEYKRIGRGYYCILFLSISLGLIATVAFVFFGKEIFSLFSRDPEMVSIGATYLSILAVSQIFMCIEITSAGGFYGLGKTKPPSITSVLFTGLRIPAALLVVSFTSYGYNGVWWCISISSVIKGVIVAALYFFTLRRLTAYRTLSIR